jgi:hypothetical protein
VQAYSKLREATNVTLSVLDLLRYPTIRLLAGAISPAPGGGHEPRLVQKENPS